MYSEMSTTVSGHFFVHLMDNNGGPCTLSAMQAEVLCLASNVMSNHPHKDAPRQWWDVNYIEPSWCVSVARRELHISKAPHPGNLVRACSKTNCDFLAHNKVFWLGVTQAKDEEIFNYLPTCLAHNKAFWMKKYSTCQTINQASTR